MRQHGWSSDISQSLTIASRRAASTPYNGCWRLIRRLTFARFKAALREQWAIFLPSMSVRRLTRYRNCFRRMSMNAALFSVRLKSIVAAASSADTDFPTSVATRSS